MSEIIVTGGCGFIGSHVVDHLSSLGQSVSIIDDLSLGKDYWVSKENRPTLFVHDILDFDSCEKVFNKVKPDVVIHLAARHYIPFCEAHMYEAYDLNIKGTLNILELSRRLQVKKFFFASTGDIYTPNQLPHCECDAVGPIYVYGQTKYMGEQLCLKYFEKDFKGSALIIGRLFNAAGLRETNPHLIPEVMRQIKKGARTIEVGNVWPKRDFVDVESMAKTIIDLINVVDGINIVNIGSGVAQEVGAVLEKLVVSLPFKVKIVSVPEKQRLNDRPYLCPDVKKLKGLIGRSAEPFSASTAEKIFIESENE